MNRVLRMAFFPALAGIVVATSRFAGLTGPPSIVPPPQQFVREFGSSSAFSADAPQLKLGSEFTLEAWIFLEADSTNGVVLGRKGAGGPNAAEYALTFEGLSIVFTQSQLPSGQVTPIAISSAPLPLRTWTHVAAVLGSGTMHLFVNGLEFANTPSPGPPPNPPSQPFYVGQSVSGALRQARVWSRALSPSEITTFASERLTGTESGLVADWGMDEERLATIHDSGPLSIDIDTGLLDPTQSTTRGIHTAVLEAGPFYSVQDQHANDLVIDCGQAAPCTLLQAVAIDFNHDGAVDLLATTSSSASGPFSPSPLVALQNEGNGTFTNASPLVFGGQVPLTQDVADSDHLVADFNGDGYPDVYLGDGGPDIIGQRGAQSRLLLGTKDGTLVDATSNLPQLKSWTESATAAEFRIRGVFDIFTDMGNAQGHPLFNINDGTGHFTSDYTRTPAIPNLVNAMAVDVNRDGWPDLILGKAGSITTPNDQLFINDGTGHFVAASDSAFPPRLYNPAGPVYSDTIRTADFDGDGWPDLAEIQGSLTPPYPWQLAVLLNNHDGTFRYDPFPIPPVFGPDDGPNFPIPVDLNGDGRPDILLTRNLVPPQILINTGGGAFLDATEIYPLQVMGRGAPYLVADVDGDGRPDIVILRGNGYIVLHNVKNFDPALLGDRVNLPLALPVQRPVQTISGQ